ncbi:sulfite exporter TauE/SafE family protein [Ereboglobus luteus]|uniref:Probable membrane transporter protein n=1 Tax=Ereboglobus luteus TaxID=1796921 RepID=A0A2U8E4V4_9BACT|nr:sulfite exporter TauE/SafE family protein [Ereboglobus luteus]AWI09893.1 hypothetical protein CKA38_12100 [Ereboglobus luteus]
MTLDLWQWIAVVFAALLVGFSKTGIAGLGILFVAIFASVLPSTKQASGIVLPLLIIGDTIAVIAYRRHMRWTHFWKLFPWAALGVFAGWLAMGRIDDAQARLLTGAIIVALTVMHIWRRRQASRRTAAGITDEPALPVWFAPMIGVLAGFTTLIANAAGPLAVIYFLTMRLPKMEFVGTHAVFFMILNWFKVPFMVSLGLINLDSLKFNAVLIPAVLVGAVAGRWILGRINQKIFETATLALGALAGLNLLLR